MPKQSENPSMIWAYLLHLGYNMWSDRENPGVGDGHFGCRPYLRCDKSLWDDVLKKMVDSGVNMVVIDLGEGVRYDSHPEIGIRNAWSPAKLKRELVKMRKMGLEPIPKLNFSTCHDTWLGPYHRMISTPKYYEVCKNLIAEVTEIFDRPRFFHLGMDEETPQHQKHFDYVLVRQFDLWWHDFFSLVKQVEKNGARPWIWSDYVWWHPETFYERMPTTVLQSNWYYRPEFTKKILAVRSYLDLEQHGYDQIPTGSNWTCQENFENTVKYLRRRIDRKRLMGFFMTVWRPSLEVCRERHMNALDLVAETRKHSRL